ncbi:tyrosine-type recombinase/integrase [Paeniroseomonas aquatica]|uniref:tyrosine-type recombinase/integrase n=1 Tax=Paeniroseomonas aquatica TaxID=373043 RepID=UPI0036218A76
MGTRQRQAAPLGKAELIQIFDNAGSGISECRDLTLIRTMRDMLARRSEIVALEVADLEFATDGTATVLIRRSKTDQAGVGEVCWLAKQTTQLLRDLLKATGITAGPLFRPISKAGVVGTTALASGEGSRILKRLAQKAGLEPSRISGHSARVGMAQDLVARGADLPAVMQAGRWKTPAMPARYAERLLAGRSVVARFDKPHGS